jgi:hypothetical protein
MDDRRWAGHRGPEEIRLRLSGGQRPRGRDARRCLRAVARPGPGGSASTSGDVGYINSRDRPWSGCWPTRVATADRPGDGPDQHYQEIFRITTPV